MPPQVSTIIPATVGKCLTNNDRKAESGSERQERDGRYPLLPQEKPPFTLKDIKNCIPEHCFERSYFRSFSYLFFDIAVVACLAYSTRFFDVEELPDIAPYLLWPIYWWFQGNMMTGKT